jgi:hypothetical protein
MAYKDPEKQRAAWRKHYANNKAQYTQRNKDRKAAVRAYVVELKATTPCADCGRLLPFYMMDFDHLDGDDKEASISRMVTNGYSLKRVKAEIAKCEIVCSNDHRERTWNRLFNPE